MKCFLLILSLVPLFASLVQASEQSAAKPNVLFIVADDLNCAISPYGDPVAHTPNLDRLAARGLTFDRAYCQQAVCNPSRSSFLTGLRPNNVGVNDLKKHFRDTAPGGDTLVTLPEHFKNNGYFCQNIGKIFHNTNDAQDRRSWSIDEVFHRGTHADDTVYRNRLLNNKKPKMKAPVTESHPVSDTVYRDGQIANLAAAALRDHPAGDQPFFLAVGFWRPHLPFVAPRRYWDLYDPDAIPLPEPAAKPVDAPEIAIHASREIQGYGEKRESRTFSAAEIRHYRHGYYAAISFLDAQLGEILDALDTSPHAKNTIVVFTSDHGFHIGEHSMWGKTSNFELDARVPLIIASPSHVAAAGRRTTALCELVDLYPTLCDLVCTSHELSETLDGISLVPVLENPEASVKEVAMTQHQQPFFGGEDNWQAWGYSLRTDRWRYTQWRDTKDDHVVAIELYDHKNDPAETRNVAADPDNRRMIGLLQVELAKSFSLPATTARERN